MTSLIEITDFSDPRLDLYARLSEAQLAHCAEPSPGLFLAESPRVIERALDAGYEPVSLLAERTHIQGQARDIIARCEAAIRNRMSEMPSGFHPEKELPQETKFPVFTADFSVLSKLTGYPLTRGAICAMRRRPLPDPEAICTGTQRIVILENVTNPTNVGAIFRSAAALSMDGILLTPSCSDPLYRRSIRVSMGTVFQIPWAFLDKSFAGWPDHGIEFLHNLGFQTAAMALCDDSVSIEDPRLCGAEKLAIILGAEGDGLCAETIAACDYTVRIPMAKGVDSLNVAAASAVAFWQLRRRRH